MSNRNFDSRVIIQRLQNQNYSRNVYTNNTTGEKIIKNPQNSDGTSSQYINYIPGAQTEYFRGLVGGGETVSIGGIVNITPSPLPPISPVTSTTPSAPTITRITGANTYLVVTFTPPSSDGGSTITNYEYSTNNGATWVSAGTSISPFGILGLTNGITYQVLIRGVNSNGSGSQSNMVTGVPNATIVQFTTVGSSTWIAPTDIYSVAYLVVGGGGGGGNGYDTGGGGGGGGGMVLNGTLSVIPSTSYSIIVGSGGAGGANARTNNDGSDGNSSSFNTVTALGGGFGKGSRTQPGGSGLGGTAAINPNTASVGGNGGGNVGTSVGGCGGGGGGSDSYGTNGTGSANNPGSGGVGGGGFTNNITGTLIEYGKGGNGAKGNTNVPGVSGQANTGNGGSAGSNMSGSSNAGGNGGSGIVILKY